MAIIRKGDTEAEHQLLLHAESSSRRKNFHGAAFAAHSIAHVQMLSHVLPEGSLRGSGDALAQVKREAAVRKQYGQ